MAPDRPSTSALTGVFAAGSPPLLESLRTLVVTPRRAVTPGETIRTEFAFSNLGGSPATNLRVRFAAPPGVTHIEGSDTLDEAPLANERLDASEGAHLGDLAPNAQRRVACSFRVNDQIEDGTEMLFQAALVTDQTPVVASNAERVIARSHPVLQNSSTLVTIAAPDEVKPGSTIAVRATIENTGASSAHDVLAFLPLPAHTQYVPRTARIAGRVLLNVEDEPFDYASAVVVAERLVPGQSVVVEYQATVDSPLTDGTRIRVAGAVSSREVAEFPLHSAEIVVSSPPDFGSDETALTVFCDDIVSPGTRVPIVVRALNAGSGDAQDVSISFELPHGLAYTPGSAHLDGQPVGDQSLGELTFALGSMPAGRVADVGISAIVMQNGEDLPIAATIRWKGGQRRFTRTLQIRVSSRFTRARNYIEADRAIAVAREDVTFFVHVFNDGTAPENDVHLRLIPGAFLDTVRVSESADEPLPYSDPFTLGIVQPHAERTFTVNARVASPVPDRSHMTLGAVLEFGGGTYDLGNATVVVRSRPHVSADACTWERLEREPLRPGQVHEIAIRFTNDGADTLRGARMDLLLPPELILERAQNARRDGAASLAFGDIPAEVTHEARVAIRLVRPPKRDRALTIEGTLSGHGVSPVQFAPLDVQTFAQPQFDADAQLRANPSQYINAGERVAYELFMRNGGDGPAEKLSLRAIPSNLAVYIPGSTTLNGMVIPDDLGTSQLWSQRGLTLTDVNPTMELRIRWEMLVIAPLTAGTAIDTRLVAEWDGGKSLALAAPTLLVESAPSLAADVTGTPISLAQMTPQLETPPPQAIVPPAPPAPPERPPHPEPQPLPEPEPAPEPFPEPEPQLEAATPLAVQEPAQAVVLPEAAPQVFLAGPTLLLDFSGDRLAQTIRALEKSDAIGLVPHLFALRALSPNALGGANPNLAQTIGNAALAIRGPLDRLFVRLRMPRLTITAKDLEDRESRAALRSLVHAVLEAPPAAPDPRPDGVVRLIGTADLDAIRARSDELDNAPLGSVAPWIVSALLLGTTIEYDAGSSDALGKYREELVNVFGVLETLPMPEFHRVLGSSVNRMLDEGLAAVLEALRAAAHVAAE